MAGPRYPSAMQDAYVVGAGQTPYGSFPDETYRTLFADAVDATLESAGDLDPAWVDEAFVGTLGVGGRQIGLPGPAVSRAAGLDCPTTRVENACAASGFAIRQAVQAVRSGMADIVLAGGFEVMTDLDSDAAKYWLGVSGEMEWERLAGATFSGTYAQMASAYFHAYDADPDALSHVAVKNHANGAKNPDAHLGFECSFEDARDATTVADPLTLYHCCPTSDGAAAVLVVGENAVDEFEDPIRIAGVGAASDAIGLFSRDTYTSIPASEEAAARAYEMADVGPDSIDIAEVHDCFAIAELLAYEDLGFCDRGEAASMAADGSTALDGDLPVNPSGGLKAKGHPIGATGAGQVVEAYKQLTGHAGDRQVEGAERALTHNVGGSGGAAVVTILERGGA